MKVVQFFLAIRTGRSGPAGKLAPDDFRPEPVTMALAKHSFSRPASEGFLSAFGYIVCIIVYIIVYGWPEAGPVTLAPDWKGACRWRRWPEAGPVTLALDWKGACRWRRWPEAGPVTIALAKHSIKGRSRRAARPSRRAARSRRPSRPPEPPCRPKKKKEKKEYREYI